MVAGRGRGVGQQAGLYLRVAAGTLPVCTLLARTLATACYYYTVMVHCVNLPTQ